VASIAHCAGGSITPAADFASESALVQVMPMNVGHWYAATCAHLAGSGTRTQTRKPPARRIGTPIPVSGRIGNREFPVSRPNRESGIPSPIPGQKKSGIGPGGSDSRFPSDVRASTAVDSEYTQQRVTCRCSHRQRTAPIQGLRRSMPVLLRLGVTSINRSGLGI
jgi:hypothetical protein